MLFASNIPFSAENVTSCTLVFSSSSFTTVNFILLVNVGNCFCVDTSAENVIIVSCPL